MTKQTQGRDVRLWGQFCVPSVVTNLRDSVRRPDLGLIYYFFLPPFFFLAAFSSFQA